VFCYFVLQLRVLAFLSFSRSRLRIYKTDFIAETIVEASAKDVDLRQLPPNTSDSVNKKRASTDKSDEPNAKKSKSEKIDM
jgi:hypothetical protein